MLGLAGQLLGQIVELGSMVDIVVQHILQQRHGLGADRAALSVHMVVVMVMGMQVVMGMIMAVVGMAVLMVMGMGVRHTVVGMLMGVSMNMLVVKVSHI